MTINSISSSNSYQRVSQNQNIQQTNSTQNQQRLQKRDGSGQGKQLNRMQANSKATQNYNYSKEDSSTSSVVGSNFDISI